MRRIGVAVLLVGLAVGALDGCSSDATSGTSAKLGETCGGSVKCAEGECAAAGFCTKSCANHSDCGCRADASDQDIANGSCDFACTSGSCLKVCKTFHDCGGDASCNVTPSVYLACE
jgi:hypothetical protein